MSVYLSSGLVHKTIKIIEADIHILFPFQTVCAEAYSRMAQVQQYLDANTREEYAQGHLDSRVEQVRLFPSFYQSPSFVSFLGKPVVYETIC